METRSNRLLVLTVLSALLLTLFVFVLWLRAASDSEGQVYLIRFQSSVAGLEKGAPVTYAGVPVGRVRDIRFDEKDPATVLVTIGVEPQTPIVAGVEASVVRSFMTGAATISLDGARRGAAPILARSGEPYPVIPAKEGGLLGGADPAELVSKISRAADKISRDLEPADQRRARERLAALARSSGDWQQRADALADGVVSARGRLSAASGTLGKAGRDAEALQRRLERAPGAELGTIRERLRSARNGAEQLGAQVQTLRPAIRSAGEGQIGIVEELRSVRPTVRSIGTGAERIDREGLVGSPALPDYRGPETNRAPDRAGARSAPAEEERRRPSGPEGDTASAAGGRGPELPR